MSKSETKSNFDTPWAIDTPSSVTTSDQALVLNEDLHHYHRFLFMHIRSFLKGKICEVGSGTGQITQFLTNYEKVTAIEPYGPLHLLALQKFAYQLNVQCIQQAVEDCPNSKVPAASFDTVVCLNLLEHIEDDVYALATMGRLAADGAHIVVVVPAVKALHGRLDRARGHFRRYSRDSLQDAFEEAGLVVTRSYYFNFLGMLAWWWNSCILGCREISPAWVRHFDRLVPMIHAFERIIYPPLGHSLLMVGRRL